MIHSKPNCDRVPATESGKTHQGDARYKGKGRQCTAMAAVALEYSDFENKRSTNLEFDFDRVLQTGDALYVKEERKLAAQIIERYLCAAEISTTISIEKNLVQIERNWDHQTFYLHNASQYAYKILEIRNAFETEVFKSDWNYISFWLYTHRNNNNQTNVKYILNSHGIDVNNKKNSNGVARIFELNSLKPLARALMLFRIELDVRYNIFKFSVVNTSETNPINNLSRPATPTPDGTQSLNVEVHSSPHPSILVENIDSDSHRTQCSRSSVSSVQILCSRNVLSGLVLSANVSSPRVVPTPPDMSQGSTVSGSILNEIKLTPLTSALAYAAGVQTNLRKRIATTGNVKVAQAQMNKPITIQKPVVGMNTVEDLKLSYLRPVVVLNQLESSVNNKPKLAVKSGRPIKNKGGCKKTKENAQQDAVKKYIENDPQKHRDAVKKYTQKNPKVQRDAVYKYDNNNLEVNEESTAWYYQQYQQSSTNGKFLTERQRGQILARLFWVAPNRGEQFYLRILLNFFACRGYTDLLRLGGPDFTTFQVPAKGVGLANDEVKYERAMQEASTFFTGHRLRRFFVLLAVNGAPVASLWDTFKNQLCKNMLHRMPNEFENAYNLCLTLKFIYLNRMLRKHGSLLASLGLPEVQDNSTELAKGRVEYNIDQQITVADEWLPRLSSEQLHIFEYIDRLCVDQNFRDNNPCAIFIDSPTGTGKTTLLNTITAHAHSMFKFLVRYYR